MNTNEQRNYFFATKARGHRKNSLCLGALMIIFLFFPLQSNSQTTDSTMLALEKRIQILEQRILLLEFDIAQKKDTVKIQPVVKEENAMQEEKKEEFTQCAAKTGKGIRCSRRAKPGTKFCGSHQYGGDAKKKK